MTTEQTSYLFEILRIDKYEKTSLQTVWRMDNGHRESEDDLLLTKHAMSKGT